MERDAGGDDVSIDINALASDLKNMKFDNISMSPRRCIFRVPNILLRHNREAYKPNAFSIGPLHYENKDLKATEKIKVKYLHGLISRFPNTDPETMLRDLTEDIRKVREEALECYAGDINGLSMTEFVKVLVLDGCFLIEYFRKDKYKHLREDDDPIFTMKCMQEFLFHDLILLENQIPWLVLQRLFEKTKTREDMLPLNILTIRYLYKIFSMNTEIFEEASVKHENKHILDLLRNSIVLPYKIIKKTKMVSKKKKKKKKKEENGNFQTEWPRMPSATSLRESGIKFKKVESTASTSILDIEFENGVLKIPQLCIQETTESLFRNLICLEQCLPNCEGVITSYAILWDHLIDTPKDTVILYKNKVIDNWLGIEDATKFFNQLYHDTCVSYFHYNDLVNKVNKYCERHWPRYRRALLRDYFKHPWALISVIAAALLLLLTITQTVFTIIK